MLEGVKKVLLSPGKNPLRSDRQSVGGIAPPFGDLLGSCGERCSAGEGAVVAVEDGVVAVEDGVVSVEERVMTDADLRQFGSGGRRGFSDKGRVWW